VFALKLEALVIGWIQCHLELVKGKMAASEILP